MRVLNYLEFESAVERSGIATAARQQRAVLEDTDFEVVTSPWPSDVDHAVRRLSRGHLWRDFDLAHLHLFGPTSVAIAKRLHDSDTPLVLHAHTIRENTVDSWRGSNYIAEPLERFLRWFYSQADLVLCPSQYTIDRLREYPVDVPMQAITNGVDVAALEGHEEFREPTRERYDLDGPVVFAVGNVFERKGLTTFCELAQSTDYEFVWFGPYDTGPHASEEVKRWTANPPANCQFTGWVDDIRSAYGAGDIYLFPTKNETQGITALEAMACGKAVVLRDIPVFEEYFTHDEDCLKCSTFAEFEDAIDRLAADPDLRERLGENARETAAEHTLAKMGQQLTAIYDDLL
ncbi:glycosyltransferase family 4 protein [Haloarculaceae archaeon H-GB2-1]|nr:glycosyltransferase family 4 protein [Haloarculaceae archaeon H-GB1-1]MEA5387059.1 glycosyltransferase family 4 protein [Haloarculaceae archaeon H-GB11]MEA5408564.1 glycosyltransferase family 4 protein [Haloarculaceae archaeon H-GB2-1]